MADSFTIAQVRFITQAAFSDTKGVSDAAAQFAPMDNYKQYQSIFKSVKQGDVFYHHSLLFQSLCDIADRLLNMTGGDNSKDVRKPGDRRVGRAINLAKMACSGLAKAGQYDSYEGLIAYASNQSVAILSRWLSVSSDALMKSVNNLNDTVVKANRLNRAGVDPSILKAQVENAQNMMNYHQAALNAATYDLYSYLDGLFRAIADNLGDPYAIDDEVMEQYYAVVDKVATLDTGQTVLPSRVSLATVKRTIELNRYSSPRYAQLVKEWWGPRAKQREELETARSAKKNELKGVQDAISSLKKQHNSLKTECDTETAPHHQAAKAIENDIATAQEELAGLGFFKFSRKSELREQIAASQKALKTEQAAIGEIEGRFEDKVNEIQSSIREQEHSQETIKKEIEMVTERIVHPKFSKQFLDEHKND